MILLLAQRDYIDKVNYLIAKLNQQQEIKTIQLNQSSIIRLLASILSIIEMQTDQRYQAKQIRFSASVVEGKLYLQVSDAVTYTGEIDSSPYYDIHQLKNIFQAGEVQIVSKTTSKMSIKLTGLKIQLISDENKQMQELKKKIQQLQNKLKAQGQWENEDLNSKEPFNLNYIYKIDMEISGYGCTSTSVSTSNLYGTIATTPYNVSCTNRRADNGGRVISKIMKKKI